MHAWVRHACNSNMVINLTKTGKDEELTWQGCGWRRSWGRRSCTARSWRPGLLFTTETWFLSWKRVSQRCFHGRREEHNAACLCYLLLLYCDAGVAPSAGPKGRLLLDMRGAHLMPVASALGGEERTWGFPLLQLLACVSSRLLERKEDFLLVLPLARGQCGWGAPVVAGLEGNLLLLTMAACWEEDAHSSSLLRGAAGVCCWWCLNTKLLKPVPQLYQRKGNHGSNQSRRAGVSVMRKGGATPLLSGLLCRYCCW